MTTTNTTTNTNTNTYEKGFYGHYIPKLIACDSNGKTWNVANKADAEYYAWHDVPEDMMTVREEHYEKVSYITMEDGKQHGMMKLTDNCVELCIWEESEQEWWNGTWIVK